jgi:hypothetical protein
VAGPALPGGGLRHSLERPLEGDAVDVCSLQGGRCLARCQLGVSQPQRLRAPAGRGRAAPLPAPLPRSCRRWPNSARSC